LSRKIPGTIFGGKSLKIPLRYLLYNSLKKHHNFFKNEDLLSENNFKNREEYFSLKPLFKN
jgi:hypothetical protein